MDIGQYSFVHGEITPAMYGRVDLQQYASSVAMMRNFLPQRYGCAQNRPGLKFVGEVDDSSVIHKLLPFSFNTDQTYVLVLGNETMQLVTDGGFVEDSSSDLVTVVTPWTSADTFRLNYAQSADEMWIVHPDYAPRTINRSSNTSWRVALYGFDPPPFQDVNATQTETVYLVDTETSGSDIESSGEESSFSEGDGDTTIYNVIASAGIFSADMVGSYLYIDTYDYRDYKPWAANAALTKGQYWLSDEKIYLCTDVFTSSIDTSNTAHHTGAVEPDWNEGYGWDGTGYYQTGTASTSYHIGAEWLYKNAGFGIGKITEYISATEVVMQTTYNFPTCLTDSAQASYKWALSAFGSVQGYPGAVGFFQERLMFANTDEQPQTCWMSQTNIFDGFNVHRPSVDDDAVTFTLGSQEVNEIRHIVPSQSLLLLTSGGVWKVGGDSTGLVTPSTQTAAMQSAIGASYVRPLAIGSMTLYLQEKGCAIRSLGYQLNTDSYQGSEISVMASHLFNGYTIVDWAYAEIPDKIIYMVRSDGAMITLTFEDDQSVIAFALHTTDGLFESVAVVSEDTEDAVYFEIARTINGSTKRYIERLASRLVTDVEDAFFVDAGLTYDGTGDGSTTVTLSADASSSESSDAAWLYGNEVTATFSTAQLTSADVGKYVHINYEESSEDPITPARTMRCQITAYVSSTACTVMPDRDVPESLQDVATTDWGMGVTSVSGLSHLEGKTVTGLGDGAVLDSMIVTDGAVSFDTSAVKVTVGLPYTSVLQTLDLFIQQQNGSMRAKPRTVSDIAVYVESTRGLQVGPDLNNLVEPKAREYEYYDDPISLKTGILEAQVSGRWNKRGQVMVVQDYPLPANILNIVVTADVGSI